MSIHIAPFEGKYQNIIQFDRNHPSDQIILITQEKNKPNAKIRESIDKLNQYCELVEIEKPIIENVPDLSTKSFYELTQICSVIINKHAKGSTVFLNLGDGSVILNSAMLYSAHLLSEIKETKIDIAISETVKEKDTVIPYNQSLKLEYRTPSSIEFTIFEGVKNKLNVTEIAVSLKYSPASISLYLKELQEKGFVNIDGRNRELTPLGSLFHEIYSI